ncbi:hypothetical protein QEZ48_07660 [Aquamicrobium lusatiense]|uniref:hypothetical protein n=1 Tax=Aquamicrobium lusatiense TaxID=89772 RepID=UPI0024574C2F|nr:hypothetical protein [Aquamicrobium lusatiense]MDH4990705.1 hypothetical protein [Aquamicrobium lusatiense]
MARDRKDIDASLQRKGFKRDDGDHHYYIYHNLAGRKTIKKTKMSMGSSHKTIGDPLLGQMARQIGVTKPSFLELVDCTLDQAGYEALAFPPKGN